MILSTRNAVRIADLYFDEPIPRVLKVDLVRYNQWSSPVVGAASTSFSSMVIDLSRSPEEHLSRMKRHTRYKIRRAAEQDNLTYEWTNGDNKRLMEDFIEHFDRCAAVKHLPSASRRRLEILAEAGALDLSFVRDESGEILAVSSYIVVPPRVRGLYAAAAFRMTNDPARRTMIGRANRYVFWQDMLRFRKMGIRLFDFGGYYIGEEDEEKIRVNAFKHEFAGEVVHQFNCEQALTLKGKLAIWAINWRESRLWRKRSAGLSQELEPEGERESSVPASV
jgi:hypothetical protein